MGNRRNVLASTSPVPALVAAAVLATFPAAGANAADGKGELEEIIVTARKVREVAQDVPAPISAVDERTLRDLGADSFSGYLRTVPGLAAIDAGQGAKAYIIRGINTDVRPRNNTATVGQYIDEIPVSVAQRQPDLKLVDVERIEVLRGPQGTLYGEGSMGGTIRTVLKKPKTDTFEGSVEGDVSSTEYGGLNVRANAMINLPIVDDKLAFRGVLYSRNNSGFIDNVRLRRDDVNDERTVGGRAAVRWTPTERLGVTFTYLHQTARMGDLNEHTPALTGLLNQDRFVAQPYVDDMTTYNAVIEYDFGWAELLSSTSYFNRVFDYTFDTAELFGPGGNLSTRQDLGVFVQETRMSGSAGPLTWIGGAFYLDKGLTIGQTGRIGSGQTVLTLRSPNFEDQFAVFGEAGYAITDTLTARVGGRWFTVNQSSAGSTQNGSPPAAAVYADEQRSTYRFGLDYKANDDVLFYALAASGFRVGGFNAIPPGIQGIVPTYKSDNLWNYEIGAKTDWLDRRLRVNISAYYIDWDDIQITDFDTSGAFRFVNNAGSAYSQGVELEVAALLAEGWTTTFSGSVLEAKLAENAPAPTTGSVRSNLPGRKGDSLPGVPQVTFAIGSQYQFDLGYAGIQAALRGDLQYVGESQTTFRGAADPVNADQDAYSLVNLRFSLMRDQWQANLYAENLFDKQAPIFISTLSGQRRINVNRPRTVGVSFIQNF